MKGPTKSDWKMFMKKVPEWQEAYMERLVKDYIKYLSSAEPASTKFWTLDKQMKKDKRTPGVRMQLDKGEMYFDLIRLMKDKVITFRDLDDFSDVLKEDMKEMMYRFDVKAE